MIITAERTIPELRKHIIFREEASPATFSRYIWTTDNAVYGSAIDQWKPPIKSPIEGLFVTGAGVTRRPGVEDAIISGILDANMISPL